eukprot:803289-Rhodomonas_salina.2
MKEWWMADVRGDRAAGSRHTRGERVRAQGGRLREGDKAEAREHRSGGRITKLFTTVHAHQKCADCAARSCVERRSLRSGSRGRRSPA